MITMLIIMVRLFIVIKLKSKLLIIVIIMGMVENNANHDKNGNTKKSQRN